MLNGWYVFSSPICAILPLFGLCLSEILDDFSKLGLLWELLSQLKDEVVREPKVDG